MRPSVTSLFFTLGTLLAFSNVSFADVPPCLAYGRPIPVNNEQILHFKRTTQNQFRERGYVAGVISRLYSDRNGHAHFEIAIGKRPGETLEVIYNQEFGELPRLVPGMPVQACGDYITSTQPSGPAGRYPPSPDGAIIHWVHMNPSNRGHDPGFLVINGVLCGQDATNATPRNRHRHPRYFYENPHDPLDTGPNDYDEQPGFQQPNPFQGAPGALPGGPGFVGRPGFGPAPFVR